MDYKKHYNLLIQKAQKRKTIDGYKEKHHIVMKSMGGSNDKCNIVELTAREHYIAHWLLFRIHGCKKTASALHGMNQGNKLQSSRYKGNSRAYAESREFLSNYYKGDNNPAKRPEVREKISKKVTGELNGMYGKTGSMNPAYGMKHDPEFLRRKQLLHSNRIESLNLKTGDKLEFECVRDCAEYYGCTTKNILFRVKKSVEGKFGMFKDIKLRKI